MNTDPNEPTGPAEPAPAAPPPSGGPATPPPSETGSKPSPTGFFNWLRSLGIVRGRERWIGGVATGVANRFGWDPVLVRGIFVVLAIVGGVGILAYGLGWALLPEPDGRIHTQEAGRGRWSAGMTGAVVLAFIGLWSPDFWFFGDGGSGWNFWPLLWLAGIGILIYVLVDRSRRPGTQNTSYPSPAAPDSPTGSYPAPRTAPATMPLMTPAQAAPPRMQPPQAYPPQMPPLPPRERTGPTGAQTAIILGLALLVIGLVSGLGYLGNLSTPAAPLAAAAAVVVLGLGCVALGLLGRRSGFIGFLAVVAILAAQVLALVPNSSSFAVATSAQWSHSSAEAATGGYALTAASGTIDLTDLSQPASPVRVPVTVSASDATVIVPDDTRVVIETDLAFSEVRVDGKDTALPRESGGAWDERNVVLNEQASGPPILLTIRGGFSSIDIHTEASEATP